MEPTKPQRGLENNPGKDGHTFNDSHPYFPESCSKCPVRGASGFTNKLKSMFENRKKDCYNCSYAKCMIPKEKESEQKAVFNNLKNDPSYKDVRYDKQSGGVTATHIGHIEHSKSNNEDLFFGGLTSSDLERACVNKLFKEGHTVLLLDESKKKNKQMLTALDMQLDGRVMDIRSVTGNGWYSNIFREKNK